MTMGGTFSVTRQGTVVMTAVFLMMIGGTFGSSGMVGCCGGNTGLSGSVAVAEVCWSVADALEEGF